MSLASAVAAPSFAPARIVERKRAEPLGWSQPLIDIEVDHSQSALWTFLNSNAAPYVSLQLLSELNRVSTSIRGARYRNLQYYVMSSRRAHVFSLGGDLQLFLDLINRRDEEKLRCYGHAAINQIWAHIDGCGHRELTTIAVVNGEAQGGGFEAALSCHLFVAERGAHCGFPESLFGLFPGMGGQPLLRARVGLEVADRLMSKPNRYPVEILHEIGVIDYLANRGQGIKLVRELISDRSAGERVELRKKQFANISYQFLVDSVEQWVAQALTLNERNLRSIAYLINAQRQSGL
jgi:DSF synthase